jgi:hypothetical protein
LFADILIRFSNYGNMPIQSITLAKEVSRA